MLEEFNTVLEGLNPRNLIQISMDGPSVNWQFHRSMQSHPAHPPCGLHILHGAFQTGVEKSEIGISSLLRTLYTLFRDSPARRGLSSCHRWHQATTKILQNKMVRQLTLRTKSDRNMGQCLQVCWRSEKRISS